MSSFSEKVQKRILESKKNAEADLRENFNKSSLTLMERFMEDVNQGNVRLEDTADMMRLFQIYLKVNDLEEGGGGSGTLPSITRSQSEMYDNYLPSETEENEKGEEVKYIDEEALFNMTEEEIGKMIADRESTMNDDNVEEI